jgi:hypothetical protein
MNSIIIHRFVGELADLYINAYIISAGFRTNEALCQLSYEAPFLGWYFSIRFKDCYDIVGFFVCPFIDYSKMTESYIRFF